MPTVFFPQNHTQIQVSSGTVLIDAIRNAGIEIDAPCGGRGTCGKCTVTIQSNNCSSLQKSCHFIVTEDISVLFFHAQSHILQNGNALSVPSPPNLSCIYAKIPRATADSPFSVTDSIKKGLGKDIKIPISILSNLYHTLQELDYEGYFFLFQDTLLQIRKEFSPGYVLAFDIGTTTIVSYLLDATSGKQLQVSGMLNPQTAYGADVISRCEYALKNREHPLTRMVRSALRDLTVQNSQKAGINPAEIGFAVIAGNTCMQHLYLGISPESLLRAPYTATVNEILFQSATDLSLPIHPLAQVAILPSIAGFVGGDTIGVLLSLPRETFDELTLILDIGTNGELILGYKDTVYTCSTAAGPAFEGAKISCGMRGASGAVEHVTLSGSRLNLSVIDTDTPVGICGSGLIDLISCLLKLHIISSRGRIQSLENWDSEAKALYSSRLTRRDGVSAFLLTDDENGIYLTQKDIREVQLAKAAISTGIQLLCQKMNVSVSDIQSVLLAGAFGNYLSPESACHIGLIPKVLLNRIKNIGNAAGEGAKLAALSQTTLHKSCSLAQKIHFVELASSKEFQATYLTQLNF